MRFRSHRNDGSFFMKSSIGIHITITLQFYNFLTFERRDRDGAERFSKSGEEIPFK